MKKGFTLIELLGTILILSAIILIIAPLILNRINKGKEIVDKQSEESLVLSAQSWGSNNRDKLPAEGDKGCISVNILEKEGYISDVPESGGILITNEGNYYYNYIDSDECRKYALVDNTPPELNLEIEQTTTKSIKVKATAKDEESLIGGYEFRIDNGQWIKIDTNKESYSYKFDRLKHNTNHNVEVRVYNALGEMADENTSGKTDKLIAPTITQNSQNGIIDYKNQCNKYDIVKCYYQKNSAPEVLTTKNTESVYFDANGTLKAKVTDGYNTVSSNATTITITIPATYHSGYYYCSGSGWTRNGTTCSKTTYTSATYHPSTSTTYTVTGSCSCATGYRTECTNYNCRESSYPGYTVTVLSRYCEECTGQARAHCENDCRRTKPSYYSCSSGTLTGTRCKVTSTKSASYSSPYYTCPSGYNLQGSTCKIK